MQQRTLGDEDADGLHRRAPDLIAGCVGLHRVAIAARLVIEEVRLEVAALPRHDGGDAVAMRELRESLAQFLVEDAERVLGLAVGQQRTAAVMAVTAVGWPLYV